MLLQVAKRVLSARGGGDGLSYFLVCFKETEYVAFLLASLYREQDYFIIHCDKKAPVQLKKYLNSLSKKYRNIYVMKSRDYSWAGFSHVELSLDAVMIALSKSQVWSHLIFLSEQHLPLKSPDAIASHLRNRKSIVALRSVVEMGGSERADVESRFSGHYRELPGVGCFVTGLSPREPSFYQTIYHGSNWMILCREHCQGLVRAKLKGCLKPFETVVHAEETAIQSVLSQYHEEFEQRDAVLVAAPHLTDNHSLIMTEGLFRDNIESDYLFIRKRTHVLSEFVRNHIVANHFVNPIYRHEEFIYEKSSAYDEEFAKNLYRFCARLLATVSPEPSVRLIDKESISNVPSFCLTVNHPELPSDISIRILSENLVDFKVLILRQVEFDGVFTNPHRSERFFHSIIRSRTFGLFGFEELLPLAAEDGGFVSIRNPQSIEPVADTASWFLMAALRR